MWGYVYCSWRSCHSYLFTETFCSCQWRWYSIGKITNLNCELTSPQYPTWACRLYGQAKVTMIATRWYRLVDWTSVTRTSQWQTNSSTPQQMIKGAHLADGLCRYEGRMRGTCEATDIVRKFIPEADVDKPQILLFVSGQPVLRPWRSA